ncbi:MAG: phosphoserine phosphatase SerB [Alphaproteobacteria bacterium]
MSYVLTLIKNPSHGKLVQKTIENVSSLLQEKEIEPQKNTWLAKDQACDLFLGTPPSQKTQDTLLTFLKEDKVDFSVLPTNNRKKKLLIADMDSTILTGETLDELAGFAGIKDEIASITASAMNGEIDFDSAVRKRVGLLKGLSTNFLERALDIMDETNGARELVTTMKKNGAYTLLVSGGFTFYTSRVATSMGFHEHHGNELLMKDGALTGEVGDPILRGPVKLEIMKRTAEVKELSLEDCLAVGDGSNDRFMIEKAGLGVGFYPKPILASLSTAKIYHGDLTALLYMQGYQENEITTAL